MSINQLHKDITGLLYKVEEDYSRIIQHGDHVPLIEIDIVLKDIRLLYEYFNELKIVTEEQRRKAIPKEKTQESAAIIAAERIEEKELIKAIIEEEKAPETSIEETSDNEMRTDEATTEETDKIDEAASEIDEIKAEETSIEEQGKTGENEIKTNEVKAAPIAWQRTFEAPKQKEVKLGAETIAPPPVSPKVDLLKEREKDFVPTVRKIEFKRDADQQEPKKESLFEKAASLYDKIAKPADKSIAAQHTRQPISNIKAAIGINDKFIYLKELFKGNVDEYNAALDKLNDFDNYADAEDYFQELKEKYEWDTDSKPFQGLAELLLRRYL
ncbi:MAG: hypothetical protein ACK4GL_10865 [Flavobacteriales bacterium]